MIKVSYCYTFLEGVVMYVCIIFVATFTICIGK